MQNLIEIYKSMDNPLEREKLVSKIIDSSERTINYFIYKYKNLPMEAEDIRGELLAELYKALNSYDLGVGCEFKTYMSKCFEYRLMKLYRNFYVDKRVARDSSGEIVCSVSLEYLKDKGVDFLSQNVSDYSEIEIKLFLDSLSLDKIDMEICDGFIEGKKSVEIAKSLDVTCATITYRVKKLRNKLKMLY